MNHLDNRELDIFLMLKYVLSKWKFIVLVTVLSAVLGLGIGFIKNKSDQSSESSANDSKEAAKEIYNSLTQDDKDRVDYIVRLNNQLVNMKSYMEKSYLMNMDAYNVSTNYYKFNIDFDKGTYENELQMTSYANQLKTIIFNYVKNGDLISELVKIYSDPNLDKSFFSDMIELSYDNQAWGDTTFLLSVRTGEDFEDLDKHVLELLENYVKETKDEIAGHSIRLLKKSSNKNRNEYIIDLQEKIRSRYDNTRNSIRLMKQNGELSDEVITCYEGMIGEDGYHLMEVDEVDEETGSGIKTILKYIIIGMIGGCLLICGLLALYYLLFVFDRYVVSKEDYNSFKLKLLGDLEDDYQAGIVASKIYKYCDENAINKIALVSTDYSIIPEKTLLSLTDELEKKNIDPVVINGQDMNQSYVDELTTLNHCIFIEKVNLTKVRNLEKLVSLCDDIEIGVAGVVNAG